MSDLKVGWYLADRYNGLTILRFDWLNTWQYTFNPGLLSMGDLSFKAIKYSANPDFEYLTRDNKYIDLYIYCPTFDDLLRAAMIRNKLWVYQLCFDGYVKGIQ